MLRRSGESRHSYLASELRGTIHSFIIKHGISCGFSQMTFIRQRKFLSALGLLDFIKCFPCIYGDDRVGFVCHSIDNGVSHQLMFGY